LTNSPLCGKVLRGAGSMFASPRTSLRPGRERAVAGAFFRVGSPAVPGAGLDRSGPRGIVGRRAGRFEIPDRGGEGGTSTGGTRPNVTGYPFNRGPGSRRGGPFRVVNAFGGEGLRVFDLLRWRHQSASFQTLASLLPTERSWTCRDGRLRGGGRPDPALPTHSSLQAGAREGFQQAQRTSS